MPKFKVSDTVTTARKWIIEAEDERAALKLAISGGLGEPASEEEIDNTAYKIRPFFPAVFKSAD